jgi:PAS domain S-box-containing protein
MQFFEYKPIRTKLKLMIISTSVLTIILVFAGFFIYEHTTFKKVLTNDLSTKADIIAENINTALKLRDSTDAARILNSLNSQPNIIAAAIYDNNKDIFATYTREKQKVVFPAEPMSSNTSQFSDDAIVAYKQVNLNGERVGTLYLSTDLTGKQERFWSYIGIAFLVLLVSLSTAYIVATILAKNISAPIISLAETSQKVSQQKDYSIRAEKTSNDETGFLADSFNQMLVQIQERDNSLSRTNRVLREEIAERERTEYILKESEERKNAILKSAIDGIISINDEGFITEFNPAAENMFGYKREDVIGVEMAELIIPPSLREQHRKAMAKFMKSGEGRVLGKRIEMPAVRNDGSEFPVELSIVRIGTEMPPTFTGFMRDITERKRAEKALRERESDLNRAQAVAHIGSWKLDIPHDVLSWSEETYRIFGMPLGTPLTYEIFLDCVHPGDRDYVDSSWQKALQGAPYNIEHRINVGDNVKWVRERAELKFDSDGKLKGGIGTVHDITERKLAETTLRNAEKRYRTTLDHMLEGCQIIGFDWSYLYINNVAVKHSRKTREELIGHTMIETYPGIEDTEMFSQLRRCMDERVPHQMENEFVYPDGEKKWFTLSIEPVPEGIFILTVDITERKKLKEELDKYNQQLEELVKERTAQLEVANKEMEAFSYSVSHDLRAPLRAVSGYARILEQDYSNSLDEEGNRLLGVIQNNAKTMGLLIDDLLALSRLGRKEVKKSNVDMTKLTKNVLQEINKITNHKTEVRISHLHPAMADNSLMSQVMTNLLSNAIKYSSKKEKPVVKICSEEKDGQLIYSVSDNGAGFDMEYADKLFGVFQRLHPSHEFEGTGVGLAIVQLIIRKHNGKVWAEGKVNEGSTFYFSLPADDVTTNNTN